MSQIQCSRTNYDDYQEGGWIIIRVFDDVRYPVYPEKDRVAYEKQHCIFDDEAHG